LHTRLQEIAGLPILTLLMSAPAEKQTFAPQKEQATRLRPDDPILELQEILADKDAFVSILPGARTLWMQGAHPVRDPAGRPEQNELT
jgi:hypothetical protein